MEFSEIEYQKTVEGKFEVRLIHNHVVVETIPFSYEELASEYVDFKRKLKNDTDKLIAQIKANLKAEGKNVTALGVDSEDKDPSEFAVGEFEAKSEEVKTHLGAKKREVKPHSDVKKHGIKEQSNWMDISAKVGKDIDIDTTAKVGKDIVIDTSAHAEFPKN